MGCDGTGLALEGELRDLFIGDGRVWKLTFEDDIAAMEGAMAIKRNVNDDDVDVLVPIISGVLDVPDAENKIYAMFFTLTDAASATLTKGPANISVRVTPFGGVTTTVVRENVQIHVTSPGTMP